VTAVRNSLSFIYEFRFYSLCTSSLDVQFSSAYFVFRLQRFSVRLFCPLPFLRLGLLTFSILFINFLLIFALSLRRFLLARFDSFGFFSLEFQIGDEGFYALLVFLAQRVELWKVVGTLDHLRRQP
jgi:hypothetical protein